MNVEELRDYCLSLNAVSESFPFDDKILVFKVLNKIFALVSIESKEVCVNLKCNPEYALELREKHQEIIPAWHMNKKHWNTVEFNSRLKKEFLISLINHSYEKVVQGISKKVRLEKGLE